MSMEKQQQWEDFLEREGLAIGFETRTLGGDDNIRVYRTPIDLPHMGRVDLSVIIDDTLYSIFRFHLGQEAVTPERREAILAFIQRENPAVQGVKFYVDEETDSLWLDAYYASSVKGFEPEVMKTIIELILGYLNEVDAELYELLHG